jgi:hypothetical protein
MSLLLITARGRTAIPRHATASAITDAFVASRLAGAEATRGNWIGPGPRITRVVSDASVTGVLDERTITVAWLYGWPTGGPYTLTTPPMQAFAAELVAAVAANLNSGTYTTWEVSSAPYNPAINGAIGWWENGDAARTLTKDAPVADREENPYGPAAGTSGTDGTVVIPPRGGNDSPPSQGMSTGTKVVLGGAAIVAIGGAVWYVNMGSKRGKRRS